MKLKDLYRELITNKNVSEIDIRDLLIFHQKYKDYNSFFLKLNDEVKNEKEIRDDFNKLIKGYPLAYITHSYPFLGNTYYVNKNVLIPRPETEELVNLLYTRLMQSKLIDKKLNILEIGTGSGVIAIDLAMRLKHAKITATDISSSALKVAQKNAEKYNVNINFVNADTFPNNHEKYDVIISNPPYILNKEDIDKSVLDNEPITALLLTKENNVYEKVFKSNRFKSAGILIFEIAPNIEDMLKDLMSKHLKSGNFIFSKDINGKVRFLTVII